MSGEERGFTLAGGGRIDQLINQESVITRKGQKSIPLKPPDWDVLPEKDSSC